MELERLRRLAGIQLDEMAGAGPSRVVNHLRAGVPFFTISAMRNEYTPEENRHRMRRLRKDIMAKNVSCLPISGGFDETGEHGITSVEEESFFVSPRDHKNTDVGHFLRWAKHLNNKFDQEGIMFGNGTEIFFVDQKGQMFPVGDAASFDPEILAKASGWSKLKQRKFTFANSSAVPKSVKYNAPAPPPASDITSGLQRLKQFEPKVETN